MENLTKVRDIIDSFRFLYPDRLDFTFFRPGCAPSRLDRFYVSSFIQQEVVDASHIASLSDHCGVKLRIALNIALVSCYSRTASYWKLNTAILKEDEFLSAFKIFWDEILKCSSSYADIADWWDLYAKPNIKSFCISYSSRRKILRSQKKTISVFIP